MKSSDSKAFEEMNVADKNTERKMTSASIKKTINWYVCGVFVLKLQGEHFIQEKVVPSNGLFESPVSSEIMQKKRTVVVSQNSNH